MLQDLIVKICVTSSHRDDLIRRSFIPLIASSFPVSHNRSLSKIGSCKLLSLPETNLITFLCEELYNQHDLGSLSSLLVSWMTVREPSLCFHSLRHFPLTWNIVLSCMQAEDATVRKRGGYILQLFPLHPHEDSSDTRLGSAAEIPWWPVYVEVYGQCEGCCSLHLIEQVRIRLVPSSHVINTHTIP